MFDTNLKNSTELFCGVKMYFLVVLLLVSLKEFVKISSVNGDICLEVFPNDDNNCSSIIVRINETKKKSGTETRILPNMTGRFNLTGKKVISIQSCHGDSIINSTHPVEVFCSDNGNRTSCVDVKCRNRCNPKNRSIATNGDEYGSQLCNNTWFAKSTNCTEEINAAVENFTKFCNDTSNDLEDFPFQFPNVIQGNGVCSYTLKLPKIDIEVITDIIDSKLEKIINEFVEIPFETIAETHGCRPNCNLTMFTARIKDIAIYRNRTKEKKDVILASDIVLVQVFINRKPLNDFKNKRAVIKIPNFNKKHVLKKQQQIYKKEPKCLYLDNETKLWSSHDVNYSALNGNTVSCSTGHFTNFAVFFVEEQPSEAHKLALGIISNIGCALSLVGVIITLALYAFLRKDVPVLSEDRNIVHFNLLISLGLVQIAFLSATATTPDTVNCTIVALILHYLFVVSFIWMFIEGIILYRKVIKAFNGENVRMGKFIVLGWVFPAIFVAVFAAFKLDDYTIEDRCFLSATMSTVWALLGPAAFSVMINIGIFIAVLHVLFRFGTGDVHKTKTLIALRSFVILTPILGFTWAFAVVVMNNKEVFWQYAFCLCNSFQGFMIFLVFGIGNSEIRAVLKRKIFPPDKWNDIRPKPKYSYDNEVEMDERPCN